MEEDLEENVEMVFDDVMVIIIDKLEEILEDHIIIIKNVDQQNDY